MNINALKKFVADESGATAIEYALIAALVSIAAIGALQAMSGGLSGTFSRVQTELNTATGSGTSSSGTSSTSGTGG